MKFWELTSFFRSETTILESVLSDPQWQQYQSWYTQFASIVAAQDRSLLDAEVPDALARAVAAKSEQRFLYYPETKLLYSAMRDLFPKGVSQELSALEAYDQFGGSSLEEVLEKSSCYVPSKE